MESGSDERAQEIAALFSREYKSLHRIAYVFVANAGVAEEIVMEAFVKVFSGWHRFRSVEHKSAYLRQVVKSLSSQASTRGSSSHELTKPPRSRYRRP